MAKVTKIYLNNEKYNTLKMGGETFGIAQQSLAHIDLADYVSLEETTSWVSSTEWEFMFENNSDRVVHVYADMYVEDSDGDGNSTTYDEDVAPGDCLYLYIESADTEISTAMMDLTATAENADDYSYSY